MALIKASKQGGVHEGRHVCTKGVCMKTGVMGEGFRLGLGFSMMG